MKDKDYKKRMEFIHFGGLLKPLNDPAIEYIDQKGKGEIVALKDVTTRDLNFHRAYFLLVIYIYNLMPNSFQKRVENADTFYVVLKDLQGLYKETKLLNGSTVKIYKSIAMGKMSQKSFEDYVRNQLAFIYEDVIRPIFKDISGAVIEDIENEFQGFLRQL